MGTSATTRFRELRLSELTVGILDRFLKAEAARGYSRGRHARVVLAQIIDLEARHDALPRNPVRSTAPLRRSRSEIRTLTLDDLTEVRRIVRNHRTTPVVPGPPPDGQLAQIFEVMLGTAAAYTSVAHNARIDARSIARCRAARGPTNASGS